MRKSSFDSILSFLLGVSWAFIFFGAYFVFKTFLFLGLSSALFYSIMFIFFGMFMMLILEALALFKKKYLETLKQTELLEKIVSKVDLVDPIDTY